MKKPWAFIGVLLYESYYFGVIRPGFLNQVPTLGLRVSGYRFKGSTFKIASLRVPLRVLYGSRIGFLKGFRGSTLILLWKYVAPTARNHDKSCRSGLHPRTVALHGASGKPIT